MVNTNIIIIIILILLILLNIYLINKEHFGQCSGSATDLDSSFINSQFIIQGIPEDKQITLYWDVLNLENIKEFKIINIDKTNNNNPVYMDTLDATITSSDITPFEKGYRCTYIIEGLTNGSSYNVVVNAISKGIPPNINVKTSNTINYVPREINYNNYSLNPGSTRTSQASKSIFEQLKGQTLEFNL